MVNFMNQKRTAPGANTRAYLIGIKGEFEHQEFLIPRTGIMLGRDPVACNIIFSNKTAGVSRHHCAVLYNAATGMFIIRDLGSTNGTYVLSTTRISPDSPTAVYSGSRFWLCSETTVFEVRTRKD